MVVANFLNEPQEGYVIGFPAAGTWKLRFNSDWQGYSEDFAGYPSTNVVAAPGAYDGLPLPRRAFHWSLQRADLFAMIEGPSPWVMGRLSLVLRKRSKSPLEKNINSSKK